MRERGIITCIQTLNPNTPTGSWVGIIGLISRVTMARIKGRITPFLYWQEMGRAKPRGRQLLECLRNGVAFGPAVRL